eukprot:m.167534 g.167534  ORF g.167534 m.167534 type:complete len:513 (-) comp15306_c0_seq1:114-1652(-)
MQGILLGAIATMLFFFVYSPHLVSGHRTFARKEQVCEKKTKNVEPHFKEADSKLPLLAKDENYNEVLTMVLSGIDPDSRDTWGKTALYYAALAGNNGLVMFLINQGAQVDARSAQGSTPLMAAISKNKMETAEILISLGADTLAKNYEGKTPVDFFSGDDQSAMKRILSGDAYDEYDEEGLEYEEEEEDQSKKKPESSHLELKDNSEDVQACLSALLSSHTRNTIIRIMSFNVRYDDKGSQYYSWAWSRRRQAVYSMILFHRPDVICLQEAYMHQVHDIVNFLKDYVFVAVGREDGDSKGETTAVLVHKKHNIVWNSTLWLSETPHVPSRGWDAADFRTLTLVSIKLSNGRQILIMNTHLDHIGSVARLESAKFVRKWLSEHGCRNDVGDCDAVFLTGDFNSEDTDTAYKALITASHFQNSDFPWFEDTYNSGVLPHFGPTDTFTGFSGEFAKRIDFILMDHKSKQKHNVVCLTGVVDTLGDFERAHATQTDTYMPIPLSDHRPVIGDILLK